MKIQLAPEATKLLTFQSYAKQPPIEGVINYPLNKHRAHDGYFMEYMRLTDGKVEGLQNEFRVRQVSICHATPGRINAFHLHPREIQDEFWCVVAGMMTVWLIDVRDGSPTLGHRRQYLLSDEAPTLLYIPAGVAHGYKAGLDGAVLIYTMNEQFDIDNPNEGRLPWDYLGAELWDEDRG